MDTTPEYDAAQRATEAHVEQAATHLAAAIEHLSQIRPDGIGSRELSTAQMYAETARMWVKAHGHDGHWKD